MEKVFNMNMTQNYTLTYTISSQWWPHRIKNNQIHVISIDASENEIKISRPSIYTLIYTVHSKNCA